jgi:hypothetical protein
VDEWQIWRPTIRFCPKSIKWDDEAEIPWREWFKQLNILAIHLRALKKNGDYSLDNDSTHINEHENNFVRRQTYDFTTALAALGVLGKLRESHWR